jgi:O-acetyl-ADP-ribose deacetylase (regulator of RNase III)
VLPPIPGDRRRDRSKIDRVPAISTGAFGFPEKLAAQIAVRTIRNTTTAVPLVHLVAFDPTTYDLYNRALAER